jgi:hypothetical protein
MGQCILDGVQPYEEAANMKLPGTYYMYALIMGLLGESIRAIHLGLLGVCLVTMYLLFSIGKHLSGSTTGILEASTYGLLTMIPGTYGFAAHATFFMAMFACAGFLFLLRAKKNPRILFYGFAGLLLGLAFLAKQQAVFFLVFGLIIVSTQELARQPFRLNSLLSRLSAFSALAISPYLLVLVFNLLNGSFERFWFWTVTYARSYTGINDLKSGLNSLNFILTLITDGVIGFWILGVFGFLIILLRPSFRKYAVTTSLFAVFSFLTTVPGYYFRNHYFIAFFPALALLIALAFQFFKEESARLKFRFSGWLAPLLFAVLFLLGIYRHRAIFFEDSIVAITYKLYGSNYFGESIQIADFIQNNTKPDDRILVFGSEPQIYFYSNRRAATGFLYTYPLMENQPFSLTMQEWMIKEIEKNKPKYLIYINNNISWLRGPKSISGIIEWGEIYASQYYKTVGLVDLINPGNTMFVWGEDVSAYTPQGKDRIIVMERN